MCNTNSNQVVLTQCFKLVSFYRATLCVSAVFAVAQCRYVLSVTFVYCICRWLKISPNFFLAPVAPSFYSFLIPSAGIYPIARRTRSAGAKYTGVGKIAIFD